MRLGRNAKAIYQHLVDDFASTNRYNSVKRYVRSLKHKDPEQFDRLELLPGEEAQVDYSQGALVATAPIFDRLMHHGHLLKFEGRSYRLKEAAARLAKRGTSE